MGWTVSQVHVGEGVQDRCTVICFSRGEHIAHYSRVGTAQETLIKAVISLFKCDRLVGH